MLSPTNKNTVLALRRPSGYLRPLLGLGLLVVWLGALWLVSANRQDIIDWWRLRHYQVPTQVSQLASQDTMTDYGRKIFYVNRPAIDDKAAFYNKCPNNGGEQTIVLGCYIGGQSGIFLLSVDDPRLNGVVQVTAAHEMLHGAYDRLGRNERQQVDTLLTNYYKTQLKDERIQATIEAYKKSEPRDVVNEMHSVFGTEVSSLPSGLEHYYRRYFDNRAQVAAFAAQYQAAFTSRKAAIAAYDKQLIDLKAQITAIEADLKTKHVTIETQQSSLVSLRDSGDVTTYNAGVPAYNNLVETYNQQVETIKNLIVQYNQLVGSRNTVALEQDELSKELSSDVAPISQ